MGAKKRKEAKQIIFNVCGNEGAKRLLKAVKKKMPVLIYDRHFSGNDPILYRALKCLGAPIVRNYDMVKDREGKVCGVYLTVFIDSHSNIASN